jgi:benzoyl-CoA reductase/2-hydroxyglutaryl-CoA dehydratase subunit BcrC/BadD/HgdB
MCASIVDNRRWFLLAERNCALQSSAYTLLRTSFQEKRDAVANLLKEGKKAIGILGDEVPEEIILAAGMVPVRLWGTPGSRSNADKFLETSFGAVWRGYFEAITTEETSHFMGHLVLSNSADIIQKLYYYLIQLEKIEPDRLLPALYYVDYWLTSRDFRSQERNWKETEKFLKQMEIWANRQISEKDLSHAVGLYNAHRAALKQLSTLRYGKNCRLTGSEAMNIIGGSFYREKKEAAELVRVLTEEVKEWPVVEAVRCFYTGSVQDTPELYLLMEEAGLNVISEDKIFGDRYMDADADASLPPLRAISDRYQNRFPSSERSLSSSRSQCLPRRAAETGAEGMVVFMNKNDESYIWDLPRQKVELDKLGIKVLVIENQSHPLKDKPGLIEHFRTFAEETYQGRHHG